MEDAIVNKASRRCTLPANHDATLCEFDGESSLDISNYPLSSIDIHFSLASPDVVTLVEMSLLEEAIPLKGKEYRMLMRQLYALLALLWQEASLNWHAR